MLEYNTEKKEEIWKYIFYWSLKAYDNSYEYVPYHDKKKIDKDNESVLFSDN